MARKWFSLASFMVILLFLLAILPGQKTSLSAAAISRNTDNQGALQRLPTDQIIIKFNEPQAAADALNHSQDQLLARLSSAAGHPLRYFRPMSGDAHVLKLPGALPLDDVEVASAALSALPEIAYAEPDRILQIVGEPELVGESTVVVPNDPNYSSQWHYKYTANTDEGINLEPAWDITTGISSTVVAVIDTGILPHADLAGRTVAGYDFISDVATANDGDGRDSDPSDPGDWVAENECGLNSPQNSSWHGTHVAGTIGAASNNGQGVAGINWQAKILPVRVLGKCGGTTSDILDGARWAAGISVNGVPDNPNPAKIINLSLGGVGGCSASQQEAINEIVAAGTTLVIAAGNSNLDAGYFNPASCDNVITVASNDRSGDKAYYSNYGSLIEVAAPGGETHISGSNGVLSTLNTGTQGPQNDSYAFYQGTSMATPHVAGVASLVLALRPDFTPAQLTSHLQTTARSFPIGSSCYSAGCGSGIVDAFQALIGLQDFPEGVFMPLLLKSTKPVVPSVYFSSTNYQVIEGAGTANIEVTLSEETNVPVQVDYATNGGTAIPGNDYQPTSGTLEFTAGQTSKPFSITILNDGVQEANKTVGLALSNPQQATLGSPAGAVLTIIDDDAPATPLANGDFESGATTWTEFSSNGWDLIVEDSGLPAYVDPHGGNWAAWLGGDSNEIGFISQQVTVPGAAPYLTYWHWIDSEDVCGYDHGGVIVNYSIVVDVYDLCSAENTSGWVKHVVNLSAYANQSINLQIRAETDEILNSNLFVDDVSFEASADAPVPSPGSVPGMEYAISRDQLVGSTGRIEANTFQKRLFSGKER